MDKVHSGPAKLTKAQEAMLSRLKEGGLIRVTTGLHPRAFWSVSMEAANLNTLWALIDRGLVIKGNEDWRGFTVAAR